MLDLSIFPLGQNPSISQRGDFPFCEYSPCHRLHLTLGGAQAGIPFQTRPTVEPQKALIFPVNIKAAIQVKVETIISRCKLYQQVPEEATQSLPRFLPKRAR